MELQAIKDNLNVLEEEQGEEALPQYLTLGHCRKRQVDLWNVTESPETLHISTNICHLWRMNFFAWCGFNTYSFGGKMKKRDCSQDRYESTQNQCHTVQLNIYKCLNMKHVCVCKYFIRGD